MAPSKCTCHSHNGFQLSPEGLAQRSLELDEVDAMAPELHLDRVGSVSASTETLPVWDDDVIDQQDRRFHHGS